VPARLLRFRNVRRLLLLAALATLAGCVPAIRVAVPPGGSPIALDEFWREPGTGRDLLAGPFPELVPDPQAVYRYSEEKTTGFSPGYKVKDPGGASWSAKLGPEASAEVTASRLAWGLGYHQPPVFHLRSWQLAGGDHPGPQGPARFRPEGGGLEKTGDWSWHQNPFVGTPAWRGALVLMVMFNNSDLKPNQNVVYRLDPPRDGLTRWFVFRDLGHSFGESGIVAAERNDPDEFDREQFTYGARDGRVLFNFTSRYPELLEQLGPADVRWTCARLAQLTPRQWSDAFRAGGYDEPTADRLRRRLQAKVAEGLALRP
jgi:hypothetical protein